MAKKTVELGQLINLFPAPVVLVTSKSEERENIIAIAWCGIVCSQPPMVSISIRPSRYSSEIIKQSGEFVVNVPSERLLKEIDKIGTMSGKEINKFESLNLKKELAEKVNAPILADCLIALECRVKQVLQLGTHDCFIAEVLAARADTKIAKDSGIDFFKLKPVVLLGSQYWNLGNKLETYGFTKKTE